MMKLLFAKAHRNIKKTGKDVFALFHFNLPNLIFPNVIVQTSKNKIEAECKKRCSV